MALFRMMPLSPLNEALPECAIAIPAQPNDTPHVCCPITSSLPAGSIPIKLFSINVSVILAE